MAEISDVEEQVEEVPEEITPTVVVEDQDGEIDEIIEDEIEEIDEDAPQYCKGSFRMLTASCFTQNENYSDDYLKSKGLFEDK